MIKIVLFDVDGVLLAHPDKIFSERFVQDYDVPPEKVQAFFEHVFDACLRGTRDLKEELGPYLAEWKWRGSINELLDYWFSYESDVDAKLVTYVQQLRAKGIICSLATNQEKYRAEYLMDKLGFRNQFDKMYVAAHLGAVKPDIEFFQKVLDDLEPNVTKANVLFWDDSEVNVQGAKDFGINAELYTTHSDFKEKMQKYLAG